MLFSFSAVKSVPASSAVDRNSSSAACSVTLRIFTHDASFLSFVMYVSPPGPVREIPAEAFFLSAPLPLPNRSFINELPRPTAFLDLGRGIVWLKRVVTFYGT